ncbi:MAG: hypothetical protein LBO70_03355 [Clostridiales Family XIII bacterium]|nr:hypothetical protein [Clostridiales Family XIII bacterium]
MYTMFFISLVAMGIGILFLALASISFYFRAYTNKRAWHGKTIPFTVVGLIFLIPGAVMLYITYPYR